jgi:hypothetical protein
MAERDVIIDDAVLTHAARALARELGKQAARDLVSGHRAAGSHASDQRVGLCAGKSAGQGDDSEAGGRQRGSEK